MVLGDPVDFLVCFGSSRSRRLDVHPERGNSLRNLNAHRRESGQPRAPRAPQPFLFVRLIIDIKLRLICLFASTVLNWLVMHLFDSLGRPSRLRELKHLA